MQFIYAATSEVWIQNENMKAIVKEVTSECFVKYLYKSVYTFFVYNTVGKSDSKYSQVNAEKYITIWGRPC